MKTYQSGFANIVALSALVLAGCASNTSPYHPGPVVGTAVGTGAGVVAGNAVGFGVGVVQGAAKGVAAPFNPDYHMVRTWAKQTTADGRVIQVPVDLLVDKYGRPVAMPPPTGNFAAPATKLPEPPIVAPVR